MARQSYNPRSGESVHKNADRKRETKSKSKKVAAPIPVRKMAMETNAAAQRPSATLSTGSTGPSTRPKRNPASRSKVDTSDDAKAARNARRATSDTSDDAKAARKSRATPKVMRDRRGDITDSSPKSTVPAPKYRMRGQAKKKRDRRGDYIG